MAEVTERVWRSGPRKVKRSAWGYTFQADGKQVRKFNAAWSKKDAEDALAAAFLEREKPTTPPTPTITLAVMAKCLAQKQGKRSCRNDQFALARFRRAFGDNVSTPSRRSLVTARQN